MGTRKFITEFLNWIFDAECGAETVFFMVRSLSSWLSRGGVYRTTDESVIAGSSSARAVKSVSWRVPCKTEVTHAEQRAYIKIAVLRERNAIECHSELVKALGNNALPYRTVARWIGKFQQGRVSTSDEQHSGRQVSVQTDLVRAVIEQLMGYIKSL
ncbi:HTH_48 domain-containing protein [Trichonephila clavipes]|nr:HTH_48 domain-containing protein [Trichonephila clavipes]